MGHVGLTNRSPGQILENCCLHTETGSMLSIVLNMSQSHLKFSAQFHWVFHGF